MTSDVDITKWMRRNKKIWKKTLRHDPVIWILLLDFHHLFVIPSSLFVGFQLLLEKYVIKENSIHLTWQIHFSLSYLVHTSVDGFLEQPKDVGSFKEEDDHPHISLHVMEGTDGANTRRCKDNASKCYIQICIENGSTDDFIDLQFVLTLGRKQL